MQSKCLWKRSDFCLLIDPPGGPGLQEVHPAAWWLSGRLRDAEEFPGAGA